MTKADEYVGLLVELQRLYRVRNEEMAAVRQRYQVLITAVREQLRQKRTGRKKTA